MTFYADLDKEKDSLTLQQGDILDAVPFLGIGLEKQTIVPIQGEERYEEPDLSPPIVLPPGTRILADVQTGFGLVLNQSCDLSIDPKRQKPILIARVVPGHERIKELATTDPKRIAASIRNLANPGKNPTIFYLPEFRKRSFMLPRSVADLLEVVCYPQSSYPALRTRLRARLGPVALQALQERLAYCFGRFGAPDDLYFTPAEWAFVNS